MIKALKTILSATRGFPTLLISSLQGFFTFAICPHNNVETRPSRACFAQHPLQVKEPGRLSTYHATLGKGIKRMRVVLPRNMTCSQCILQYTYTSGNNWGTGAQSAEVASEDCLRSGEGKLGCGSQETFRGCADICIGEFCPQDQDTCLTADKIAGTSLSSPTTTRPDPVSVCRKAGVRFEVYTASRHRYCRERCLMRTRDYCYNSAAARLYCYCHTNPVLPSTTITSISTSTSTATSSSPPQQA